MIKRLSVPSGNVLASSAAPQAKAGESPITLDKRVVCVHAGQFASQDGAIGFDKARIQHVVDRNNAAMAKLKREYAGSPPVGAFPPIYEDHANDGNPTRATIGRLLGPFTYEERNVPNVGSNVPCVVSECVRFLGAENCERASDGRLFHVSIGIDEANDDYIKELSVVPEPAAPGAMLLAKGENKMAKPKYSIEEKDGMFLVKTPQGYIGSESHKTREEADEAGKQWAEVQPEVEDNGDTKPKAKEMKLSKEKQMINKEALASIKRLAGEAQGIKKVIADKSVGTKHLARKAQVDSEMRGLMRLGKMTPAEFKLAQVKFDSMAKLDKDAFGFIVESYKNRQPVITAGQQGTSSALEAGAMAGQIGEKHLKAETKRELKRLGAKIKTSDAEDKFESGMKRLAEHHELSEGFAGAQTKEMGEGGKMMEHLEHLSKCLEAGDHEKAKEHIEHMKKMAEEGHELPGMKHMAAGEVAMGDDQYMKKMSEVEEHVGQLSAVVDRMSAEVDKLVSVEADEGHKELGEPKDEDKKLGEEPGEDKKLAEEPKDEEKKLGEDKKDEDKKDLSEGEPKPEEKKMSAEEEAEHKKLKDEARKTMGLSEGKEEQGDKKLSADDAEDLDKK